VVFRTDVLEGDDMNVHGKTYRPVIHVANMDGRPLCGAVLTRRIPTNIPSDCRKCAAVDRRKQGRVTR